MNWHRQLIATVVAVVVAVGISAIAYYAPGHRDGALLLAAVPAAVIVGGVTGWMARHQREHKEAAD
jgi:uncharacterized membrane protein YfcA